MFKTLSLIASTIALFTTTQVAAHGSILMPTVAFLDPPNKNAPSALVRGTPGPYTGNAVIKDLAEANGSKCGKTDANAPVQPIPADGMVQLLITAAHIGPCELWLDNVKVASARECVKEFPDRKIKVDFSKCRVGKCQLRWVWLATHNSPWEIYDNCVNVGGGNGGSAPSPSVSPSPAVTSPASTRPTPATQKPAPPTDATPGTVAPPSGGKAYKAVDGSAAMNFWCNANCERGFCPRDLCSDA